MIKLKEWSLGAGKALMSKMFALLSKKSGETYRVIDIPNFYQNRYGKFMSYMVVSSRGNLYRVNFILGKSTEEIASIDRFAKGANTWDTPIDTISFEGFNIIQIYNSVLDWLKGVLTESDDSEDSEFMLREAANHQDVIATFLQNEPSWIQDCENGNFDSKKFQVAYRNFCSTNGLPPGDTVLSHLAKALQGVLKKLGQTKAANNIPVVKVVPGAAGTPISVSPSQFQAGTLTNIAQAGKILSQQDNMFGVEELRGMFETAIRTAINRPDIVPNRLIVACGQGGVGKTYTVNKIIKECGLSPSGYSIIKTSIGNGKEALFNVLFEAKDKSLLIFDDVNNVLNKEWAEILKVATDTDAEDRMISNTGFKLNANGETLEPGSSFFFDAIIIICTNRDYSAIDAALKTRMNLFDFKFSDRQLVSFFKEIIANVFPDDPDLTPQVKDKILGILHQKVEDNSIQGLSVRLIHACCCEYLCALESHSGDPYQAIEIYIKKNRHLAVEVV